jgi:hypothetical protein
LKPGVGRERGQRKGGDWGRRGCRGAHRGDDEAGQELVLVIVPLRVLIADSHGACTGGGVGGVGGVGWRVRVRSVAALSVCAGEWAPPEAHETNITQGQIFVVDICGESSYYPSTA